MAPIPIALVVALPPLLPKMQRLIEGGTEPRHPRSKLPVEARNQTPAIRECMGLWLAVRAGRVHHTNIVSHAAAWSEHEPSQTLACGSHAHAKRPRSNAWATVDVVRRSAQ